MQKVFIPQCLTSAAKPFKLGNMGGVEMQTWGYPAPLALYLAYD
jgi:hypothetical protein